MGPHHNRLVSNDNIPKKIFLYVQQKKENRVGNLEQHVNDDRIFISF